ncbi:hypothetical protein EB820_25465 [Brevibacillus agri]|uniref:Uncharacterized protein n=1 Tax=Brevibacillus agri TaxID=51101 RepID=A0A3M8A3V4_9BACL|nr:hypothetical protein [Brevibacillus agri]QAV12378.1 hypothetical protein BA6348_06135 [Brevibacillus agri]RNB45850.1 hypothetical protein EB820_25465 [Brevibacillus agri]
MEKSEYWQRLCYNDESGHDANDWPSLTPRKERIVMNKQTKRLFHTCTKKTNVEMGGLLR